MIRTCFTRTLLAIPSSSTRSTVPVSRITNFFTATSMRSEDSKPHEFIEDNIKLRYKTADKETYIEAVPTESGREGKVIETPHSPACALCRLNIKNLNYTDVMILAQFVKRNGRIVTYHESKLCSKQYNKVLRSIEQAQRCNLMERPANYLVPGPWHDLNTYIEPDRKRDQPMKVIKKQYWRI